MLGLNTTATSLLGFLNIAELGIGSAIAVTLYRPIFDDNKQSIKEIVALQGWLYRIVAFIIMVGSIIMMFFFPHIFKKADLPLWYTYASFGVLLYSALLGYLFNYKQILLDAHQMNYKVQLSVKLVSIVKLVVQAFAVKFLDNGYIWWLALEVFFSTLTAFILNRTIYRTFPYIREKVENPSTLRNKYPEVVTKVKQLFIHKISGFLVIQTTPLIIYAFSTLTLVAKYGNYLTVTNNLNLIIAACFLGLTASVGNMLAENDKNLAMKVFRELFSIRFLINFVCCICLWFLIDPFISVWIGNEYILDRTTVILLIFIFYLQNSRNIIDTYINALGLYRDIWSPIVESIICLGLSILLGKYYGLNGILTGWIISQILIIRIWKPYFLFSQGLDIPVWNYVKINAKHIAAGIITFFIIYFLNSFIKIDASRSFFTFVIYGLIIFVSSSIVMFLILYSSESGMRNFMKRLYNLKNNK